MTSATEKELSELHRKVASVLLTKLDSADQASYLLVKYIDEIDGQHLLPDDVREYLVKQQEASPALLTVITKFLKDNNITASVEDNKDLSELDQRLAQKRQRRAVGNVVPIADNEE